MQSELRPYTPTNEEEVVLKQSEFSSLLLALLAFVHTRSRLDKVQEEALRNVIEVLGGKVKDEYLKKPDIANYAHSEFGLLERMRKEAGEAGLLLKGEGKAKAEGAGLLTTMFTIGYAIGSTKDADVDAFMPSIAMIIMQKNQHSPSPSINPDLSHMLGGYDQFRAFTRQVVLHGAWFAQETRNGAVVF